jgi:hypothetical protein
MRRVSAIAGFLLICTGFFAQEQPVDPTASAPPGGSASSRYDPERCGLKNLDRCFRDLVHDQAAIWTSPLRVKPHDAIWLVPFAASTGAAFAFDEDALRQVSVTNKGLVNNLETDLRMRRSGKPERYILWAPSLTTITCERRECLGQKRWSTLRWSSVP